MRTRRTTPSGQQGRGTPAAGAVSPSGRRAEARSLRRWTDTAARHGTGRNSIGPWRCWLRWWRSTRGMPGPRFISSTSRRSRNACPPGLTPGRRPSPRRRCAPTPIHGFRNRSRSSSRHEKGPRTDRAAAGVARVARRAAGDPAHRPGRAGRQPDRQGRAGVRGDLGLRASRRLADRATRSRGRSSPSGDSLSPGRRSRRSDC